MVKDGREGVGKSGTRRSEARGGGRGKGIRGRKERDEGRDEEDWYLVMEEDERENRESKEKEQKKEEEEKQQEESKRNRGWRIISRKAAEEKRRKQAECREKEEKWKAEKMEREKRRKNSCSREQGKAEEIGENEMDDI